MALTGHWAARQAVTIPPKITADREWPKQSMAGLLANRPSQDSLGSTPALNLSQAARRIG